MKYTRLGQTGLEISALALGCMTYGVPDRGTHPVVAAGGGVLAADQAGGRARH
jgi:aryl-alcohol dehydrogenase-like predicted oxidoreductase